MMRAGAVLAHRNGLVRCSPAGVREQGIDTGGFPRNLGRPIVSVSLITGLCRGCQTRKPRAVKSASDLTGATNTDARGGNRRAKATKRDGTGGGESERFIVPWKPGNSCRENPVEGRGRLVAELWAGHRARALNLDPRFTKRPRAA